MNYYNEIILAILKIFIKDLLCHYSSRIWDLIVCKRCTVKPDLNFKKDTFWIDTYFEGVEYKFPFVSLQKNEKWEITLWPKLFSIFHWLIDGSIFADAIYWFFRPWSSDIVLFYSVEGNVQLKKIFWSCYLLFNTFFVFWEMFCHRLYSIWNNWSTGSTAWLRSVLWNL